MKGLLAYGAVGLLAASIAVTWEHAAGFSVPSWYFAVTFTFGAWAERAYRYFGGQ